MALGCDYAFFPHPELPALKTAGVRFVCRYVSMYAANDGNGKNLLPAEKTAILAAGLPLVIVAEEGATYMLGGYTAGVALAAHADAVVRVLGMPGVPIYGAADSDFTEAQQTPINSCLDGMASVIGRNRTGIYGGYHVVKRALDAGKAQWMWQTIAWSGGQWDPRAHIRQDATMIHAGGVAADRDDAMFTDYGQWPRPAGPKPAPPVPPAVVLAANPPANLRIISAHAGYVHVGWDPCAHATGYTIQAVQLDGVIERKFTVTGKCDAQIDGLRTGWVYNILVWAIPAKAGGPHATLSTHIT
jgi:hypothetical protein